MIGKKIMEIRKEKNVSRLQLARKTGHSYSTLYKIENGSNKNPGINHLVDIAKVLGVSVDEFLGKGE